ncbi:hypothetical protein [Pseudolysinimonas sp.]
MLAALIALELAALAVVFVVLVVDVLVLPAASLGTALALVVTDGLAVVTLGAVLVGIWRGRAWVRAVAVVFQVLIAAIGIGALQGAFAQPGWGWPLIVVGIVGFVLLISKSAKAWLSRRDEDA